MQGNGENKNVEIKGNPKSPWVKIAAAVVVIAVVFFGYRAWKDGSSQPVQQAAAEPVVIVKQVEKFDASSVPSEYVGRVESIQSVSVKPQISGEIAKVCFKEGSVVKAGQLLFQIDPKQYEATVQLRKAELQQAEVLLRQTKPQPQHDAEHGTQRRNKPALEQKDTLDEPVVGTHVAQGCDVVFFVDNEHRQRAYDVETGNH